MYKNVKHSCTIVDLRHLFIRDLWLCVFVCTQSPMNSNGWLGHLIGSVDCDVTVPLWRHQDAVSCLGWDKSISDSRGLSSKPRCTRHEYSQQSIIVSPICMCSHSYFHPVHPGSIHAGMHKSTDAQEPPLIIQTHPSLDKNFKVPNSQFHVKCCLTSIGLLILKPVLSL